ncbi:MAG: GNAT family N-acetyltransferase [Aestuariibacter sp.]
MNLSYIEDRHLPELLRLNNLAVPAVNELQLDELEKLVNESAYAQVVADEYAVAGFILAFKQDADYQGFNYSWFKARFSDFLYIDRIVVNPSYRGQGVGRKIYSETEDFCRKQGLKMMTCEVNLEPDNPVSHQFHKDMGFDEIEAVLHPEGKRVMMYQKEIAAIEL